VEEHRAHQLVHRVQRDIAVPRVMYLAEVGYLE
jgi:hypothetical protein